MTTNRNLIALGLGAGIAAVSAATMLFNAQAPGSAEPLVASGGSTHLNLVPPMTSSQRTSANNTIAARVANRGGGRLIVQVAAAQSNNASAQDQAKAIASTQDRVLASASGSVNVVARFDRMPFMVVEADADGARSLANLEGVVSIMEDHEYEVDVDDTIPLIHAPEVYDQGVTGEGFSVAILDSGVEATHQFLRGRVVVEGCFSTSAPEDGVSSLCPDGSEEQFGSGASNGCPVSIDGCSHGTHVAGIAAGNGGGGSGVAKDASIVALQVFSKMTTSCGGGRNVCILSRTSDQMRAMEWVLEHHSEYNIAAINMSLGGDHYTDQASCDEDNAPYKDLVDQLVNAGVAVVASAGNESYTDGEGAPGCISSIISVGSTTKDDEISDFSNSGEMVDLWAPGSDIVSSVKGNKWGTMSGTSMASPHVAGAFTLLRSARPEASVADIFEALWKGGVLLTDPRNDLTRPRIQLDTALEILTSGENQQPAPAPQPQPKPQPSRGVANDDQGEAMAITTRAFRHTVNTSSATMGDDPVVQPSGYCPEGGRFDHSVWYSFTAPTDGYLMVSTEGSDYDTIVSVWKGSRGAPVQTGCNDDDYYPNVTTTTIGGWVPAGATFRIMVAAWDDGGDLVFQARFTSGYGTAGMVTSLASFDLDGGQVSSDAVARPAQVADCGEKERASGIGGECFVSNSAIAR